MTIAAPRLARRMLAIAPRRAARLLLLAAKQAGTYRALVFNPDQPRDEQGQWTSGGGEVFTGAERAKVEEGIRQVDARIARLEEEGRDDPQDHEYDALTHMATALEVQNTAPGSQRQYVRSAVVFQGDKVVAAGVARTSKDKRTAEILNVGSISRGAGKAVMDSLHEQLRERGVKRVELISTARRFYERQGYQYDERTRKMVRTLAFNPDQPRDEQGQWTSQAGAEQIDMMAPIPRHMKPRSYAAGFVHFYHVTSLDSAKAIDTEGLKASAPNQFQGFESQYDIYGWANLDRARLEVQRMEENSPGVKSDMAIVHFQVPKSEWGRLRSDEDTGLTTHWKESYKTGLSAALVGDVPPEWIIGHFVDKSVRALEFNPDQARDERGRWTDTGGDFVSAPEDALDDLAHGERASVAKGDVRDLVMMAADNESPVELTKLTIEGTPLFTEGKDIPRASMPQIPGVHRAAFFKELKEKGIAVTRESVSPGSLLPTQGQINAVRVGQMLRTYEEGDKTLREIMISRDDYVLDGHHRWAVQVVLDADNPRAGIKMPVERLSVDHRQAIRLMRDYNRRHKVKGRELAEWDESLHPRDEAGKFTDKGSAYGEAESKLQTTEATTLRRAMLQDIDPNEFPISLTKVTFEQRGKVKKNLVNGLTGDLAADSSVSVPSGNLFSDREAAIRQEVQARVDLWADTSGDSQSDAIRMQRAVAEEFAISDASLEHMKKTYAWRDSNPVDNAEDFAFDRKFVRAEYNRTQAWFKERGITHVTVYRGMGYSPYPSWSDSDTVTMQPASSWTTEYKVANDFARGVEYDSGRVLGVRVPVTRVLSTAITGRGCLKEAEVILLGGEKKVRIFPIGGNKKQGVSIYD